MNNSLKDKKISSWAFKEAEKLLKKLDNKIPEKGYVLFETGYGPSGLPHLGTFGEVARTSSVIKAFKKLAPQIPVKLFAYSDDLDGLRKIPENIPNKEIIEKYIGFPLSKIPDPFCKFDSYADYMNNKLQEFLNDFGFEFEFHSAKDGYYSGKYNSILSEILAKTDEILSIMQPSLGEERRKTYHPFLPISKKTGKFCFNGVISHDIEKNTIKFINDLDEEEEISIFDGNCKLQWKVDWAMRWMALDVDYEMHGKDITPSSILSQRICKALNRKAPITYAYEFFTDELGQKISKSKGNGVSIDEWLRYGNRESLALFIYDNPHSAKKLFLRIIPKFIDDYINYSKKFYNHDQNSEVELLNNPIFYMPFEVRKISNNFKIDFNLIMNIVGISTTSNIIDKNLIFEYILKYQDNLSDDEKNLIYELIEKAFNFYSDFILPNKSYLKLNSDDISKLQHLNSSLKNFFLENNSRTEEEIQNYFYEIARQIGYDKSNMKEWFIFLYEAIFGNKNGPRFGSFIKILGYKKFCELLESKILP